MQVLFDQYLLIVVSDDWKVSKSPLMIERGEESHFR